MSSKQSVLLTSGVLILVIIGMVMNFYTTSRANDTVSEVQRLILEGRQIGNVRGNVTLGAVGEAIQEINQIQTALEQNLTRHRVVTNMTFDKLDGLIAGFNQTNEVERVKAVQRIIDAVNNNTELIKQLLKQQDTDFDTSGGIASIK